MRIDCLTQRNARRRTLVWTEVRHAVRSIQLLMLTLIAGCDASLGLLLGERPLRRLEVSASESDHQITLAAAESVGEVSCYVSEPLGGASGKSKVRAIWSAHCKDADDCFRSITYGATQLETRTPAEPLRPSLPGECYDCLLLGTQGRGQTWFRLDADGKLASCPLGSSRPADEKT